MQWTFQIKIRRKGIGGVKRVFLVEAGIVPNEIGIVKLMGIGNETNSTVISVLVKGHYAAVDIHSP